MKILHYICQLNSECISISTVYDMWYARMVSIPTQTRKLSVVDIARVMMIEQLSDQHPNFQYFVPKW